MAKMEKRAALEEEERMREDEKQYKPAVQALDSEDYEYEVGACDVGDISDFGSKGVLTRFYSSDVAVKKNSVGSEGDRFVIEDEEPVEPESRIV